MGRSLGIVVAVVLHLGFVLFGGAIFGAEKKGQKTVREVELLSSEPADEKKPEPPPEDEKELEEPPEKPPDAAEILERLDRPDTADTPALDALSLGALEQALQGAAGAGEFGEALGLVSGGRIGGTGSAGALGQSLEKAFSLAEIDQKPRVMYQAMPLYPSELRGKKVEGVVSVLLTVDPAGKVGNASVERSSHPAFERPALDAVKQWKFEPAIKGGQRVSCKMRAPIRFAQS